jgi:hypothetical protein
VAAPFDLTISITSSSKIGSGRDFCFCPCPAFSRLNPEVANTILGPYNGADTPPPICLRANNRFLEMEQMPDYFLHRQII